ncbi:hypothetical protein [Chitinivorax sp. B]|uniref:hypothetical protein n=1 Tax=Chitinivorax sp. B TaxID=2502235 RepID=UPI0010F7D969|nr:hypothetical protein [Chitinivorax sp. B]
MKQNTIVAVLTAAYLMSPAAHAIGAFSRACSMKELSDKWAYAASAQFFIALGAPASIADIPPSERVNYFVLESITADYGQTRYWLWAASEQYSASGEYRFSANRDYSRPVSWQRFRSLESPWGAYVFSDAINNSPTFQKGAIFNHNRRLLYSARAGVAKIVEKVNADLPATISLYSDNQFKGYGYFVRGTHYYHDPRRQKTLFYGLTKAQNCNLSEMGF